MWRETYNLPSLTCDIMWKSSLQINIHTHAYTGIHRHIYTYCTNVHVHMYVYSCKYVYTCVCLLLCPHDIYVCTVVFTSTVNMRTPYVRLLIYWHTCTGRTNCIALRCPTIKPQITSHRNTYTGRRVTRNSGQGDNTARAYVCVFHMNMHIYICMCVFFQ